MPCRHLTYVQYNHSLSLSSLPTLSQPLADKRTTHLLFLQPLLIRLSDQRRMRDVPHLVAVLTGYWYWRVGRGGDDVNYEDVEWWEVTFCADLGDWRGVKMDSRGPGATYWHRRLLRSPY